jgi:hypothetical protein
MRQSYVTNSGGQTLALSAQAAKKSSIVLN